ncbi:MAG: LPS assembly protein LptD [Deltaproteobacteria bacterium]|nr:LPS assembly protein LptD [Deltaproteobacteria bacterium]
METFYYHHMGRRGDKVGFEYRYVLDTESKGTFMYDYFNDMKVDNGTTESEDEWGYAEDGVTRPNSDRYWFRMKSDQAMPYGFNAKLDIDFVSDQDYLHEFEDGYTGFNAADKYFTRFFGRGFDDYDDATRVNSLNISKIWSTYSLNAEVRWYDNVINRRRQEEADETIQKLPVVEFNASKQQILKTPFYFDFDSQYTYFYREDGSRAHRADVYPRFYLPLKLKNYCFLEPSFGVRETVWRFDKEEYRSSDKAMLYREFYDIRLDLSSEIYKIYGGIGQNINRIKHTITPQVVYNYIPGKDQSKYPRFDSVDNVAKKSLVTYSITNTFTLRAAQDVTAEDNPETQEAPPGYSYNQFCRFKLEQSYDINEAKEDNPSNWANQKEKQPFSPVYGEIELALLQYFSVRADATWSQYESDFQSRNIASTLSDKRGDRLFVEHRYTINSVESIYTNLSCVITDNLKVYGDYERNQFDSKDISKSVGCLYKAQCWSIDFEYIDEENDRKYMFVINLYGIGEFGRSLVGRTMEEFL